MKACTGPPLDDASTGGGHKAQRSGPCCLTHLSSHAAPCAEMHFLRHCGGPRCKLFRSPAKPRISPRFRYRRPYRQPQTAATTCVKEVPHEVVQGRVACQFA